MEHQDWTPVVFNNTNNQKKSPKRAPISEDAIRMKKLDEGTYVIPKVSVALQQQIRDARNAKGLSQKDLASRLNVKATLINSYEIGNVVPEHAILQKMSKILGVNLKMRQ